MNPTPNPTPLAATRSDRNGREAVPSTRNLFCPHYQSCLNVAVKQGWPDWTCSHCELVGQTPAPSATRFSRDRPRE